MEANRCYSDAYTIFDRGEVRPIRVCAKLNLLQYVAEFLGLQGTVDIFEYSLETLFGEAIAKRRNG